MIKYCRTTELTEVLGKAPSFALLNFLKLNSSFHVCYPLPRSLAHGAEPFLWSCQMCSYSKISKNFMEPEGSVFTRALHSLLFWATSIHTIPFHPISRRSILILSTNLRLGLPSGLLPSGYPTNVLYAFLLVRIRATCPAYLILLDLIILIILGDEVPHYAVFSNFPSLHPS
jgi:hypothetical protein